MADGNWLISLMSLDETPFVAASPWGLVPDDPLSAESLVNPRSSADVNALGLRGPPGCGFCGKKKRSGVSTPDFMPSWPRRPASCEGRFDEYLGRRAGDSSLVSLGDVDSAVLEDKLELNQPVNN